MLTCFVYMGFSSCEEVGSELGAGEVPLLWTVGMLSSLESAEEELSAPGPEQEDASRAMTSIAGNKINLCLNIQVLISPRLGFAGAESAVKVPADLCRNQKKLILLLGEHGKNSCVYALRMPRKFPLDCLRLQLVRNKKF